MAAIRLHAPFVAMQFGHDKGGKNNDLSLKSQGCVSTFKSSGNWCYLFTTRSGMRNMTIALPYQNYGHMDANSLFSTEEVNQRIVSNYNKAQLDQEKDSNSKDTWTVQKIFLWSLQTLTLSIIKNKHLSRTVPKKLGKGVDLMTS